MRSWIIFLGLLFTTFTQAQVITGRVTDLNNHPIELAVVIIQTNDSVYVNSTYTDSLGSFSVKAEISPFLLTVQHLLYETYQSTYDSLTIGNIQLNEKSQTLSEVSVTGERPLAKVVDGKITYSMPHLLKDKMAVSAYEAILELPGVREQSGKIQLAGTNGVTVIINGKTTNMGESQLENLLKNMPKERIQEAEIMYSAPPQYHVRGAVINLVLTRLPNCKDKSMLYTTKGITLITKVALLSFTTRLNILPISCTPSATTGNGQVRISYHTIYSMVRPTRSSNSTEDIPGSQSIPYA